MLNKDFLMETKEINTKGELENFRRFLKEKDWTECRLLYRSGKYELTFYKKELTYDELVIMGFRKAKKEISQ